MNRDNSGVFLFPFSFLFFGIILWRCRTSNWYHEARSYSPSLLDLKEMKTES